MCWTTEESLPICTEKHKPNQLKTTTATEEVLTNNRSLYTSTAQQHASGSKPKQPIFHLFCTCLPITKKIKRVQNAILHRGDGQDHPMTLGNEKNRDLFFFLNKSRQEPFFSLCPSKKAHSVLKVGDTHDCKSELQF